MNSKAILATAVACLCVSSVQSASADNLTYEWYTVANNGDVMPTDPSGTANYFNSYNQPAVSKQGMVVFRARSRGGEGGGPGQGEPERGIYMRNLAAQGPLFVVFRRQGTVPQPNNTTTGSGKDPASFNEFPSVPRIDAGSGTIATRGQSTPVWTYMLADGFETRTGTAGVYTSSGRSTATTGASMLGDVYGYDVSGAVVQTFPYFQVPVHGAVKAGTGFDQFPGSPAVTERNTIVFKGNFAVGGVGKTGVFYRDIAANGGKSPVELIASSYTKIPKIRQNDPDTYFGSTAPPSAGGKYAVFAGYDNEGAPKKGGIYRVRLGKKPIVLETVVKIEDQVPGEPKGTKFEVFGEALSVSSTGRTILFWGGWGGKRNMRMQCPEEGNAAVRAFCATQTPYPTYGQVPKHQGFFVRDMQLETTTPIIKTGDYVDGVEVTDFVYWNFSGRVPGKGHEGGEEDPEETEELARWRSTSFGAVSGNGVPNISAFKARTADGKDGIYLRRVLPSSRGDVVKLLKTGDTQVVDVSSKAAGMKVSAVGIERDGFRGNWLALTASMLAPTGSTGWAGVYVARFLDDELVAD